MTDYLVDRSSRASNANTFDGVNTTFGPFGFEIFDVLDVVAEVRAIGDTLWILDTSASFTKGENSPDSFTVTFAQVYETTHEFRVRGARVHERSTSLARGNGLNLTALAQEQLKEAFVLQEMRREMDELDIQEQLDGALTAQAAAETAQAAAETAETNAETSETNAASSASSASTSATSAANSASSAASSKTAAETAETNAETAETNAASSATSASTSATSASGSATAAASSATSAANSASSAASSKTAAETAETNAETAETNAASSATSASTSATSAANSASSAASSKTAAETAETNAETAETNAASSASSASTSATSAANSATSAASSKTAAETAETNAETAETNAASSASSASTSATSAANSATSAGNSATSAAGSATSAATSATQAAASAAAAAASAAGTAADIGFSAAGDLASDNVQDALEELDSEKASNASVAALQWTSLPRQTAAHEFTGIPATATEIEIIFTLASGSTTGWILITLGDAGGLELTNYECQATRFHGGIVHQPYTTGFIVFTHDASVGFSGTARLVKNPNGTNEWSFEASANASGKVVFSHGSKSLSGVLDRIEVDRTGGVFDGGYYDVRYK